jgi:hypothetical protein
MTGADVTDILTALGGLGGLGALVTSLRSLAETRRVREDTRELRPDHGESVADQVRSLGHQMGEHHQLIMRVLDQQTAQGERITLLEHAPRSAETRHPR